MQRKFYALPLLFTILITFTACGGGTTEYDKKHYSGKIKGSEVGHFIDSAVEGLEYTRQTGTTSLTNRNGTFYYKLGETVNFKIGNLDLGTTFGLSTTTPKDIVSFDERELNTSIYAPAVNNRVRMLMSLDEDDNPNNGIFISETIREDARFWSTPDYDLNSSEFDNSFAAATNKTITVPKDVAEQHFAASLRCSYSGAYRGYQILPNGAEGPLVGVMIQAYDKNISKSTSPIIALSDGQDLNNNGVHDQFLYALGNHNMDTGSYKFDTTYQFDKDAGRIIGSPLQNVTGDGISLGYNKVEGAFRQGGNAGAYVTFRVGEGNNTAYRYTGYGLDNNTTNDDNVSIDPILGLFSFDVDINGHIYGLIHDARTNLEPELNGNVDFVTGITEIHLTLNGNNYLLTGIIPVNTNTLSNTVHLRWQDSNGKKLGYIDGVGCQLRSQSLN